MKFEKVTLQMLKPFTGLNEESVQEYYKAEQTHQALIEDRILEPFAERLKAHTGFSNDNLSEEKVDTKLKLGSIEFVITSEPRVKRPEYKTVFVELNNYVNSFAENYTKNINSKGMKTIDDAAHVELDMILEKITELTETVTLPEIKQTIKHNYDAKYTGSVTVPLTYDLELTPAGAMSYVQAQSFNKVLNEKVIAPFKNALKEETGYNKSNIPNETVNSWVPVDSHLFMVQSKPEGTVKYAEIMKALVECKETKKGTKKGELLAIKDGEEISDDIEQIYHPRERSGKMYVSLSGLTARLEQLKDQCTEKTLNQHIHHYPHV